ncbi:MAG TPA: response regulator transcription factor [Bryobacteraceae bacterium]|nr:response regulator transcription factor [Bryobacteraceae bacterium]
MRRPTVILADDHTIVMEGLRKLLERDFEIADTVSDGAELLASAGRLKPDVVLLDISMPRLNGIEAARQLKEDLPATKLIFLTMHADAVFVSGAFRAGAHGYVLKRCAAAELVEAIHEVLRGRTYVTPEISHDLPVERLRGAKSPAALTRREREVLQLVAEGKAAKEIAAILSISPKTVVFHKTNIMAKLGVRTTAGLTQFAVRHGVVGE